MNNNLGVVMFRKSQNQSPVYQKYTQSLIDLIKKFAPNSVQKSWLKTFPKDQAVSAQFQYLKDKIISLNKKIKASSEKLIELQKELKEFKEFHTLVLKKSQWSQISEDEEIKSLSQKYGLNLDELRKNKMIDGVNKRNSFLLEINRKYLDFELLFREEQKKVYFSQESIEKIDLLLKSVNELEGKYKTFFSPPSSPLTVNAFSTSSNVLLAEKPDKEPSTSNTANNSIIQENSSPRTTNPNSQPSSSSESPKSHSLGSHIHSEPVTMPVQANSSSSTLSKSVPNAKKSLTSSRDAERKFGLGIFDFDPEESSFMKFTGEESFLEVSDEKNTSENEKKQSTTKPVHADNTKVNMKAEKIPEDPYLEKVRKRREALETAAYFDYLKQQKNKKAELVDATRRPWHQY